MRYQVRDKIGKFRNSLVNLVHSNIQGREMNEIMNNQVLQRLLFLQYQQLNSQNSLPCLDDVGFRIYSQSNEDGLILFIFSLIGMEGKKCVEVGFGSPFGANTTNLIINWGWLGLLIEGNGNLLAQSKQFFNTHKDTWIYPPQLVHAWVTAENINDLLRQNDFTGEIDLFSLDLDGIDYWIWKNLDAISPKVVVVEYQDIWGPMKSVTIPYDPDFRCPDDQFNYCGASLSAFIKLGQEKGYRLVGCNLYGFNAIFIKNGVGDDVFPEVSPEQCFKHPKTKVGQEVRLPAVQNLEWVEL